MIRQAPAAVTLHEVSMIMRVLMNLTMHSHYGPRAGPLLLSPGLGVNCEGAVTHSAYCEAELSLSCAPQ